MTDFYFYIINNYSLSGEAKRIVDNICKYAADYEDGDGKLTEDGINFIDDMLSDAIGLTREEISMNWGYTL